MVSFFINQLVSGEVVVKTDSVYALPQSAIISSGKNNCVYAKESESEDSFLLRKIKVNTGRTDKGFVELMDVPKVKILIEGTYNLRID